MGKYYKDSLKGLLTRRLLILVLVMIVFMSLAAVLISYFFLDIYKLQATRWCLNLGNLLSKNRLNSKAYEFGNAFQSQITDLQSYKRFSNDSFDGSLPLTGAMAQRDFYYMQFEVYNDKAAFEQFMVDYKNNSGSSVLQIDGVDTSQLRADFSQQSYNSLTDLQKKIAWAISAVDAAAMPVMSHWLNFDYYYGWYTGFANGLFYLSPGVYEESELGSTD